MLLLACFTLGINRDHFIILTVVATVVLVAEMFNSAIEETVDLISRRKNVKARIIKDMAAGAVLFSAAVALVVAYFIIMPYVRYYVIHGISIAKHTGPDIATGSVIIVMILVIVIKAYTGKGHPLRGGMPSGHAAISFAIWVAASYTTKQWYIALPILLFAAGISVSRVLLKIHSKIEVLAGAIVGSVVTVLLYLVFY
jgi:diacylglycerol kinase (ATP)